jgi:hypothetical protein
MKQALPSNKITNQQGRTVKRFVDLWNPESSDYW